MLKIKGTQYRRKIEPPTAQQQIFDTGIKVGEIACKLFHGGSQIPFDIQDLQGMAEKTNELIQSGVKTIYEASFIFDEIGPHCFSPDDCGAYNYCWRTLADIPEKSVFSLTRAGINQKFSLYRSGIIKISDVPLVNRPPAQQLQILGKLDISPVPIREFVDSLEYPN